MNGNMGKMMKQLQKMQAEIVKTQEALKDKTVEASAGGGAVKVVVNGHQEVVSVTIAPEACDPDDVEMLQDLVVAAVNEALRKSQEMASGELEKITSGLNIPGLGGLGQPFGKF